MDIEVFKAQHPEVFAAVKKLGSDEAWDTVHAHITLAEGSGAMKTAIDDIKARKPVTVAVQSHHMSASMNRHAINARQAETDWASAAVSGAGTPSNEGAKDLGDLFAESLPRSSAQAAHAR